ncbi:MAG: Ni/Fe hydrogenase subunit alpha [Candidatus Bathyarchaeota archaeon]|nr:Ni/Fe hydrogenase subunit alpha [Candidatus Bathyarchaeota archaeon]MDH5494131.1 Ni/Fe hydrogenase subunit alpha [Candidatus Bathyarchaeota archaeon]
MTETPRQITITPTTRIEGHGKVTILLDKFGNVSDAHFHATEIRGFEQFLRGMESDRLPFIISRICGVCSTAHIMASVKAIEDAYQAEIPETAQKIRELLLMAQVITNHSLVFFFLTLPDFWFKEEENPQKRNIFQIMREDPEIGKKALDLKMFGTRLLTTVGGRHIHIVSVIPGGVIRPLTESQRIQLLKEAKNNVALAQEALALGKNLFQEKWDEFRRVAVTKTNYMGLTKNGNLNFYEGKVRVKDAEGKTVAEFLPKDYIDYVDEKALEWTYAKFAYLKKQGWPQGIVKVSSTARMNIIDNVNTPLARQEFLEFKKTYGTPAHETLLFDYARLIELLHACEKAQELLEDKTITKPKLRVTLSTREAAGVGLVEAPRGTLLHRYSLDKDGRLKDIRLIIPTQVNNAAINVSVKSAAEKFIKRAEIKPGLLNKIEMVIRAYDPCIKCASRTVESGSWLRVEVRDSCGELLKVL